MCSHTAQEEEKETLDMDIFGASFLYDLMYFPSFASRAKGSVLPEDQRKCG